jgi:phage baseplate assembly protein W
MANSQHIYSDLDLTFKRTPVSGDVALRYDAQAVISSVRNLLLTNFYERPFQPTVGSNLTALLFEPATNVTASILSDEIQNVITNFEPRAVINNINVSLMPDQNSFSVDISFFIGNSTIPTNVSLLLQRSR